MKSVVYITLILNCISFAQDTIKFANQTEINNFNADSLFSSLVIESDSLLNLASLDGITFIENDLIIRNCKHILSNEYFKNLEYIGGKISITNNDSIINIRGFYNLKNYRNLEVINNINLDTIRFENNNIQSAEKCYFYYNPSLKVIDLATNTDTIIVYENDSVGILRIEPRISINYIEIKNNPSLFSFCDVFNIWDNVDSVSLNISQNGIYSSDLNTIQSYCTKETYPCGKLGVNSIFINSDEINNIDCENYLGGITIESDHISHLTVPNNIRRIDGNLIIKNCINLTSINLTNTLDSICGSLQILNNPRLKKINIEGIDSLQKINIINNDSLTQMTLRNYNDSLIIEDNNLLEACCDIGINPIEDDTSKVSISNNATGCNSLKSLEWSCNSKFFPCGREGYTDTLSLQSQIDDFSCGEYFGSLHIEADEITDLTPLEILNKIEGNLTIKNCTNLSSISITNTLDSIAFIQIINNPRLKEINIEGIESTRKISISNNDSLTQVNLSNNNDSLVIMDNNLLEACCDLGFNPNSDDTTKISITNNASGCNSLESLNWSCSKVFFPCGREGYTDTFNTAESINNIDCNHYLGSMIIDYDSVDEPMEFYSTKTISGNLTIQNNNTITDLFFLENLDSIKNLKINNCNNLKTINGLNIKSIDTLILQNNNKLYACDEIMNLIDSGILNSIEIILDSNARSCNNLNQIQHYKRQKDYPCGEQEITDTLIYQFEIDSFDCQYFTGSLLITDNQILNLEGLKNLKSVNYSLGLVNLNIDSVDTLTIGITEKLTIRNNNRLKNISYLNPREAIRVIEISYNDSLSAINYLPFGDSLIIKNNQSLDNCCIIADNLFEETDRYILIDSNNTNCNGLNAIKNYCLETAFPCGIIGVTDTFKENSDFDIECIEYNGNMFITGSNLNAIDSSNNIIYINGDLIIEEVNQPTFFGFENIENIYGNLVFKNNSISKLKAFRNLYEIQNRLIIDGNNRLISSPIDAQTFVRNITITNNDSMRFLYFGDGQTNQNRLKSIEISGNQSLESIDGMFSEHMDSIKISNNFNLISINAITFTDTVYDILEIRDNPKLSECCSMEPLLNSLSDTSSTVTNISNNADSCISVESILNNCQVFTSYKQQKYNTYDLKINQNNGSFIELSGSALENSDKIYVIGITGNIIACLPYNNSKKQTLNIENYSSGLYLIAASSENRVLKAVKLFKK